MDNILHTNAKQLLNKVPQITLYFWVIKILATTVGETAADFLNINLHLGLAGTSVVMAGLLAAFLIAQVRAERYLPALYWVTVVLISIAGTLITDNLTDRLGVPLQTTTLAFSLALALTFAIWYRRERTLSIRSIDTRRRELFYWAAILFTFALGTAAGDLVAERMSLGYANSALLFSAMIGAVALAYYAFRRNGVLAFWIAYILTRPLGASCGDFLSQPAADGGLGMGTVQTSVLFLAAITSLVIYLSLTRKDIIEQRIAP
ncbi:MAG: hypothetical protein WC830_15330 [Burkholderiales bacterium]